MLLSWLMLLSLSSHNLHWLFCCVKSIFVWLLLFYSFEISHQRKLMGFYWRLSESKSPQFTRTLLSILTWHNNAVVWMVTTCPVISKSFNPFIYPLVTVPSVSFTIGITVTMSKDFLVLWQGLSTDLSLHFLLFLFCGPPGRKSQVFGGLSFCLLPFTRSGCVI